MQKADVLNKLEQSGIVAVIRGDNKEQAIKTVDAVIAGGITAIELTFTVPEADQVIATLTEKYKNDSNVIIGAGTVLEPTSARLAIINGAKFIVSPNFNKEVAKLCNLYCIPYTPGCLTPDDIQTALTYGADLIKVFPGNVAGMSAIKAFKGPFPYINIMPTGGVDLDNMENWFKAGAAVVGAGSNLIKDAKDGNYTAVTEMTKKYRKKLESIKL